MANGTYTMLISIFYNFINKQLDNLVLVPILQEPIPPKNYMEKNI